MVRLDPKTEARRSKLGRRHPRNLVLGTVQWGLPYGIANRTGTPPLEEIAAMLETARRAGIETLDTARPYGTSEALIGALGEGDAPFTVVAKLDPDSVEADLSCEEAIHRAEVSVARSLRLLRRDSLDLLLLHRGEHRTAYQGRLWETLSRKRARGEIGQLGISAANPAEARAFLEDPTVDVLQVAASLLDQRLARRGFFERAAELGKPIFVRSIYLQGVAHLAVADLPAPLAELAKPLEAVNGWAREHGLRRPEVFLLYARDLLDAKILIGCETLGQLCQNLIAWRSLDAPRADLETLTASIPDLPDSLLDPSQWRPG